MPAILAVFLLASVLLTLACLGSEAYSRHTASFNHMPYTHITLEPSDDYADFVMFVHRFPHFHQGDFFSRGLGDPFLYPATVGVLSAPFYLFLPQNDPENRFLAEFGFCLFLLAAWFQRSLVHRGLTNLAAAGFTLGTVILSYPFYFEFNRANIEFYIWLITALGVLAFLRNRPWLAATLLGIAGACKFYPFIYVALLIARRQYKQAAWSFFVAVMFTDFSLWALTGNMDVSRDGTAIGLATFRWFYVLRKRAGEIGLDHSLFGFYKRFAPNLAPPEQLAHQLTIFLAIAAVIAVIAWFARAIRLPVINQVLFLTIAAITLPPVSYDYTLQHLYTPFVLMVFLAVDFWRRGVQLPKGAWAAFICFMLLLAPLNEFIVHGERISGQLKCVLLLALAAIALCYPFVSDKAISPAAST
jgi:hypothetical protein